MSDTPNVSVNVNGAVHVMEYGTYVRYEDIASTANKMGLPEILFCIPSNGLIGELNPGDGIMLWCDMAFSVEHMRIV